MVDSRLNKLPIRLVQENGNTINLDVTSYNVVVDRSHSQIPIPLKGAQSVGIDLNMPSIRFGLTGVITDDAASNDAGKGAVGEIDFGYLYEKPPNPELVLPGPRCMRSWLPYVWGCGEPNVWEGRYQDTSALGMQAAPYIRFSDSFWNAWFELPLAHWRPQSSAGTVGASSVPPVDGMALWLDASSFSTSDDGDSVSLWTNKAPVADVHVPSGYSDTDLFVTPAFQNGDSASTKPKVRLDFANGLPVVDFDGDNYLDMSTTGMTMGTQKCAHQLKEQTVFLVMNMEHTLSSYDIMIDNAALADTPFQAAGWKVMRGGPYTNGEKKAGWRRERLVGEPYGTNTRANDVAARDNGYHSNSCAFGEMPTGNQLTLVGFSVGQDGDAYNSFLEVFRQNSGSRSKASSVGGDSTGVFNEDNSVITDIPVASVIEVTDYSVLNTGDVITVILTTEAGSSTTHTFTGGTGAGEWEAATSNTQTATNIASTINAASVGLTAAASGVFVTIEPTTTSTSLNSSGKVITQVSTTQAGASGMSVVRHKITRIGGSSVAGGIAPSTSGDYAPNFDGKLAEFIIYPRVLTDSEIYEVEAYLLAKWGIPVAETSSNPLMAASGSAPTVGQHVVRFVYDATKQSTHYEPNGYVVKSVCTPLEIDSVSDDGSEQVYVVSGYGTGTYDGPYKVFAETRSDSPYVLVASNSPFELVSDYVVYNNYDVPQVRMLGKLKSWTNTTITVDSSEWDLHNCGFFKLNAAEISTYKYIWILRESQSSYIGRFKPKVSSNVPESTNVNEFSLSGHHIWCDTLPDNGATRSPNGKLDVAIPVYDLMNPTPKYDANTGVRSHKGTKNPIEYMARKVADAVTLSGETGTSGVFYYNTAHIGNHPTSNKLVILGRTVSSFDASTRTITTNSVTPHFKDLFQKGSHVYAGDVFVGEAESITATQIVLKLTINTPNVDDILYTPEATLDKAFTVDLLSGGLGSYNGRVAITQKTAGPLTPGTNGEDLRHINHHFPSTFNNTKLVVKNFTGGRAASKVKSAGDKAQDLMGLAANMQNFGDRRIPTSNVLGSFAQNLIEGAEELLENVGIGTGVGSKDYIRGIQIPYTSYSTKATLSTPTFDISQTSIDSSNATDTRIRFNEEHGFSIGDQIRINDFGLSHVQANLSVDISGVHTVKSVISEKEIVIDTDTSANTYSMTATGSVKKILDDNYIRDQRNFYVTYGSKEFDEVNASNNIVHASTPMDFDENGPEMSGIAVAMDKLDVRFDAEARLYEFDMVLTAIDYLV